MGSIPVTRPQPPAEAHGAALSSGRAGVALPAIAGAWLVALVAELTGSAGLLHHHALIEGGTPIWVAVPLFVGGWFVMVVAMMLPPSLSTLRRVERLSAFQPRSTMARAIFLGAFLLAWTVFGLAAFAGDDVLHHLVDATPWLSARSWLIQAGVLATAGGYQLLSRKRRSLAACRHPATLPAPAAASPRAWFRAGLEHGLACLGSSWALMLLVFAEGFANLWWMAILTAVMTYEVNGRHGIRVARVAGVGLLLAALVVLSGSLAGTA